MVELGGIIEIMNLLLNIIWHAIHPYYELAHDTILSEYQGICFSRRAALVT